MRIIIVERSDWFTLDASDAVFLNLETNEEITGEQWLDLPLISRGYFVLSSDQAETKAIDGNIEEYIVSEYIEPAIDN